MSEENTIVIKVLKDFYAGHTQYEKNRKYFLRENENKQLLTNALEAGWIKILTTMTQEYLQENFILNNTTLQYELTSQEKNVKDHVYILLIQKDRRNATESLATFISENNMIYTIRDDNGSECWIYEKGIFVPNGKTFIKQYCRKILGEAYTTTLVNEVIAKIEADTYIEADKFFADQNMDEICVENGILNIKDTTLKGFTPNQIFFQKIPVTYDHNATCPAIKKHLKDVLKNEQEVDLMLELFGYLLLKDAKFEKAFMFSGSGRNGKGKTMEIMKNFLGPTAYVSLHLQQLTPESFELEHLFGKLANLAGDISDKPLDDSSMFKSITGRDMITVKRKFKPALTFQPYAKQIFACNQLPTPKDNSPAFWERWIFFDFPYMFISQEEYDSLSEEERKNKKIKDADHIKNILTPAELSGLLNEALNALSKLLSRGDFSKNLTREELQKTWLRRTNSFLAFAQDCLREDYEAEVVKGVLKKEYIAYCRHFKLTPVSDKAIRELLTTTFAVQHGQKDSGERVWKGVSFESSYIT